MGLLTKIRIEKWTGVTYTINLTPFYQWVRMKALILRGDVRNLILQREFENFLSGVKWHPVPKSYTP